MKKNSPLTNAIIAFLPYIWIIIFFLLPFLIIIALSLSEIRDSIPPYKLMLGFRDKFYFEPYLGNYKYILSSKLYRYAYWESIKVAFTSTIVALIVGYPIAYGIARSAEKWQSILLIMVLIPFFTSSLIRVYCWMTILKTEGILNNLLLTIGLIKEPLKILNTKIAVVIGIVYAYLPFMVIALYSSLEKISNYTIEAAADLGARPIAVFWRIIFPLSFNGIIAGCMMVFVPAMGEFVIPDILGGSSVLTIGKVIWNEYFLNRDWPIASALAVSITVIAVLPIMLIQKMLGSRNDATD